MEDLLTEVKIFERRGTARPDSERILVVGYGNALLCRQHRRVATGGLVHLSSGPGRHTLVGVLRRVARAGSVWRRVMSRLWLRHLPLLYHQI